MVLRHDCRGSLQKKPAVVLGTPGADRPESWIQPRASRVAPDSRYCSAWGVPERPRLMSETAFPIVLRKGRVLSAVALGGRKCMDPLLLSQVAVNSLQSPPGYSAVCAITPIGSDGCSPPLRCTQRGRQGVAIVLFIVQWFWFECFCYVGHLPLGAFALGVGSFRAVRSVPEVGQACCFLSAPVSRT